MQDVFTNRIFLPFYFPQFFSIKDSRNDRGCRSIFDPVFEFVVCNIHEKKYYIKWYKIAKSIDKI